MYRAVRFPENPLLHAGMDPRIGTNLNGPSLIRVPDWVAAPLGRYYLYFAHHQGTFIRMAYADDVRGPWTVHRPGVLSLEQTPCRHHIASPDVHVLEERRRDRPLLPRGNGERATLLQGLVGGRTSLRGRSHGAGTLLLPGVPPRRRLVRHRPGARAGRRRGSAALARRAGTFRARPVRAPADAPCRGPEGGRYAAPLLQPRGGLPGADRGLRHAPRRRLAALACLGGGRSAASRTAVRGQWAAVASVAIGSGT